MTNLTLNQNCITMSSREIADLTKSRHDSVKRSIERMANNGIISFTPTVEPTLGGGKPTSIYCVNKRDSYIVVAQLSPEFTAALVDRWQELEAKQGLKIPTNFAEALQLAADQAKQLELAAPKIEFVDRYVESSGNKSFREVCKLLKANERQFRSWMVANKIQYLLGGHWTAYQNHIDSGRFSVNTGEKNGHAYTECKFTPKGVQWISELWNDK